MTSAETAILDVAGAAFGPCEICGAAAWRLYRHGPIRAGSFGTVLEAAVVAECGACGVQRLAEACCPGPDFYATEAYRLSLGQGTTAQAFVAQSDGLQITHLNALADRSLRDLHVADVGAAGGSFLDHVIGVAGRTTAIEPAVMYHQALTDRGHAVYASTMDAVVDVADTVDLAVSFHVIEHVDDPRTFLGEMSRLLGPDGRIVVSTPNREDILMGLLPDDFPAFFYRVAHRWYFDAASLARCAQEAGLVCTEMRHVHRLGLSNAFNWLRDRRPRGDARLPGIEALADAQWGSYLEATGRSDTLYAWFARP